MSALDVEEFLTWLAVERGRSTNTLAAYRRDLDAYAGWLKDRGSSLEAVGEHDIEDYVAHQRALGAGAELDGPGARGGADVPPLLRQRGPAQRLIRGPTSPR